MSMVHHNLRLLWWTIVCTLCTHTSVSFFMKLTVIGSLPQQYAYGWGRDPMTVNFMKKDTLVCVHSVHTGQLQPKVGVGFLC